jgi:CrcB protein
MAYLLELPACPADDAYQPRRWRGGIGSCAIRPLQRKRRRGSTPMNFAGLAAVGAGSLLGAWLRWWLGLRLNALFPTLPLGTLAANLIGGYIIGVAVGMIMQNLGLSPQARLFLMTGFCGGLTTFSTFSAETYTLLARGQLGWGLGEIAIHVSGSLVATALGVTTVRLLRAGGAA